MLGTGFPDLRGWKEVYRSNFCLAGRRLRFRLGSLHFLRRFLRHLHHLCGGDFTQTKP